MNTFSAHRPDSEWRLSNKNARNSWIAGVFMASQGGFKTLARLLLRRGVESHADLLGLDFILVVIPRADGGVDKATKEEKKTDKQYNAGHSTVESMPSSYAGGL